MKEIPQNIIIILLIILVVITVIDAILLFNSLVVTPIKTNASSSQGTVNVYALPKPSSNEGHVILIVENKTG